MPIKDRVERVLVSSITVRPGRQRRDVDTSDLIPSIRARGVLQPIIITHDHVLVAGERRLKASIELGLPDILCRFVEDLSPLELQIIEYEENVKRKDLTWQEQAVATLGIHRLYVQLNDENWTIEQTGNMIGLSPRAMSRHIDTAEAIESGDKSIISSPTQAGAETILLRRKQRKIDEAVNRIFEDARDVPSSEGNREDDAADNTVGGSGGNLAPGDNPVQRVQQTRPPFSIMQADALNFFATYSGQKFNFLHCDFPYGVDLRGQANQDSFEGGGYDGGEDLYWPLLERLLNNWRSIMMPSCHFMFWISMKHYSKTINWFEEAFGDMGLEYRIDPTPLVWHKTDNSGILPDPKRGPRQIYEACLYGSTGDRFIVKPVSNTYGCPTYKSDSIHTNEKPEVMLTHFMGMFVDEHTRGLDPTCGSGSSIRTLEKLGAEYALGLELNPEFVERAEQRLRAARSLRSATGG